MMRKIRCDSVLVSSALLSLALAWLLPHNLGYAAILCSPALRGNPLISLGFSSIAIVVIGLIVIWTAYLKRSRWAWVVVFAIVWLFAFPVYMLPFLLDTHGLKTVNWSQWIQQIIAGSVIARATAKGPIDFLLMLIALLVPLRSFFAASSAQPGETRS
jgi:hypothetical protein